MYPGIGKDLIMIIIGGLGWNLLKLKNRHKYLLQYRMIGI